MGNGAFNQNTNDAQKEEYEALEKQIDQNKKRFITILSIVAGALVLLFMIVFVVNTVLQGLEPSEREIYFYPPYEGNIMEYQPYLDLDRKIYYCDQNVILSVEEDNLLEFDYGVLFLCDFIQTMIDGDADAYNGFFTNDPEQAPFSPQMIYATQITYESAASADNGDRFVTYKLEYRILRNDGTLRRDIGSRESNAQYAVLRITDRGFISIESLTTRN